MTRVRLILLLLLAVILCPKISTAQMALTTINPNSEREFQNTDNQNPVKSETFRNGTRIISLVHAFGNSIPIEPFLQTGELEYQKVESDTSIFYITSLGYTQVIKISIPDYTVTDFSITDDTIYMCGFNPITATNFFTILSIADLLTPSTTNIQLKHIYVPVNYYLTKIYFDKIKRRVLMLSNTTGTLTGQFIAYHLMTNVYEVFTMPEARPLDIAQTRNKIAVLGMNSDEQFTLFCHDFGDLSIYTGKKYLTNPLYMHFTEPKYHMIASDRSSDHVIVCYSAMNNSTRMEFSLIDLNSLNVVCTQGSMNSELECRSKILSLQYDTVRSRLYCLFCNGAPNRMQDMIMYIIPYYSTGYFTSCYIPQNDQIYYNLMKDITLYKSNAQLLGLGRTIVGNLYFFDRICGAHTSQCVKVFKLPIDIISPPEQLEPCLYTYNSLTGITTTLIPINNVNIIYDTICY